MTVSGQEAAAILTPMRRFWRRLRLTGQILWQTLKRFEGEERRRDAAALTYTTLFALVPVITVTYAILSAIPELQSWGDQAHGELLAYVMPEGSETISAYLVQFSQQARKLTWVGVAFLFVTAFMLLRTIEMQFNRIWNVDKPRSGLQTFFRYWAVLSLGPLLFGAAFAASSLLAAMPLWQDAGALTGQIALPVRLLPWLLSSGAICALYMLVPNCRVPWRNALLAAVLVATVFEAGKFLFAKAVGLFPSYQLIYGAFAAVPLFLLWIYLAWMLLLLGAELSYSLSHVRSQKRRLPLLWQRLLLLQTLWQAQQSGQLPDEARLCRLARDLPAADVGRLLQEFQQQGWATQTQDQQWVWIADLNGLSLASFFRTLTLQQLQQPLPDNISGPAFGALQNWQQQWLEQRSTLLDMRLSELLPAATTAAEEVHGPA
ncbi:YihY family inner membrane protein [Thalassolituus hydrocarboniclasticus]|uniref:UPF0761 membrane protein HUF19_11450 n=1 Tax=Thalassolituus hydrocarboniclasticus TaxID=2742796 RepID=A0ABY6AB87_9GAMM|nr:YihY family inner membrane protein [Thalassolituus hydrocarboniclasticus]UXD88007.1 YihY family inner membrane protein [Thalassolituus hydrocarboniclasticus]